MEKQEEGIIVYETPWMILKEIENSYILKIKVFSGTNLRLFTYHKHLELKIDREIESSGFFYMIKSGEKICEPIYLDKIVDTDNIKVEYENSILTEIIPKKK